MKKNILDDESTIEVDEEKDRVTIELSRRMGAIVRIVIACVIAALSLVVLFLTESVILKYLSMFVIIVCSSFCAATVFMLSKER